MGSKRSEKVEEKLNFEFISFNSPSGSPDENIACRAGSTTVDLFFWERYDSIAKIKHRQF